ncbi:hypothetical protein F511_08825 [Dorcoceras hygrometricum]|uniref:Uncharacterized protein n=1 Tax=Dorcoceras hygrometricum TaxID=472368 RepID=A0A2Z7AJA5_9LAMI|nr:hypothetical protein F511_08825 [Dorcoceras hygrometricum]
MTSPVRRWSSGWPSAAPSQKLRAAHSARSAATSLLCRATSLIVRSGQRREASTSAKSSKQQRPANSAQRRLHVAQCLGQEALRVARHCGSLRQSGPRPDPRLLRQAALEALTRSARTDSPRRTGRKQISGDDRRRRVGGDGGCSREGGGGFGIQLAVGPQPLWLRNHNSGPAQRIMVKRLATSPHDPLGITYSACKNQSVVVSVQYGPFNPYIPIRSATIGKSRVAIDPIAMHTSWRSNSDIANATRVSMTFRVVRTNQYDQDLGLIHSTNGNHLESPKEGSSIDHQVTIYLHAQNITMFPTNETCTCVTLNGSGIQLAVGPQPLWLRNHNSGPAQRIMVKRLATSPNDPLGITDSACKNQSVVVSVQYGPFNPYIPIRSTTIGKSRVARDPIAMHTSWRSNSDIASVTSIGYPRMSASGESSTTMHRLLHASGSHPIPTPGDPK